MNKKLLFSLLPGRDFFFKTMRAGGPGGQHQNKVETAVRLTHPDSGVEIRVSDEKSQHRNKRIALRRLVGHKKFKTWLRVHVAMIMEGYRSIEDKVKKMMAPNKLKIEYVTTFCCDGLNCWAREQVTSTKPNPPLPKGWEHDVDMEGDYEHPKHFCPRCVKEFQSRHSRK